MPKKKYTYIDLFAGCGGLSLGLHNAGWSGLFAVEKNVSAFGTLKANLMIKRHRGFTWPRWLPKKAIPISTLLKKHSNELRALEGKVTLLAGGPPCQGFSMAGRRTHSDPRNSLIEQYIKMVEILKPRIVLIENVRGFTLPFKKNGDGKDVPYSKRVIKRLECNGYKVFSKMIDFSQYGVPQIRNRFFIIALRSDDAAYKTLNGKTPFDILQDQRKRFLSTKGLPSNRPVSVKEAIKDLEVSGRELIENADSGMSGFTQIDYKANKHTSAFIKLMRKGSSKAPDSLRLPRHKTTTIKQFNKIITTCPKGKTLNDSDRKRLGIKKHALTPLKGNLPAATITTLPDDLIHYSEPRILTVRENARIQTFPDWFQFTGQYTTGGANRKKECPRYTQVGNAVPPLFAEAMGRILKNLVS